MKKVKADDYYNDGVFELARFGLKRGNTSF